VWTLRRRGDKQKIAEAFHVTSSLEDLDFGETFDATPGSVQPVVYLSEAGERELGIMRWGFKLPDRLLFNVRSEGVTVAKFWKTSSPNTVALCLHRPTSNGRTAT
jgi:putative SOS response-associated peptidase YedK